MDNNFNRWGVIQYQAIGAMSKSKNRLTVPRSIRHKKILDIAADKPDASLEAISSEIPSATPELVDHVLDEYGDPADDQTNNSTEPGDKSMELKEAIPNPDNLTSKQLETLGLIYENPNASQRELGGMLDVSGSTVSNRVNSIEGFEWENRQAFVAAMFDTEYPKSAENGSQMLPNETESQTELDNLTERVIAVEQQVEDFTNTDAACMVFDNIDIIHKVIHACMKSDTITEEEELTILKQLVH